MARDEAKEVQQTKEVLVGRIKAQAESVRMRQEGADRAAVIEAAADRIDDEIARKVATIAKCPVCGKDTTNVQIVWQTEDGKQWVGVILGGDQKCLNDTDHDTPVDKIMSLRDWLKDRSG